MQKLLDMGEFEIFTVARRACVILSAGIAAITGIHAFYRRYLPTIFLILNGITPLARNLPYKN